MASRFASAGAAASRDEQAKPQRLEGIIVLISLGRLRWVSVGILVLVGCVSVPHTSGITRVSGIRFFVDAADAPSPAQSVLGAIAGVVEFGGGRGRFDVGSSSGRAVSVDGVVVTPSLANGSDYYLFDSAGFVLVRPRDRTFSVFRIGRSWIHRGDVLDPSEGFLEFAAHRADTLPLADPAKLREHGPFTVRYHVDRRRTGRPPIDVLSRGWIDVTDAPAGEATAVRWFGAGAALAALWAGTDSLQSADLQLSFNVGLSTPGRREPLNLVVVHSIRGVAHAEIDASRLIVPPGFTQTVWPGFEREMNLPMAEDAGARWRRMPDAARR